MIIENKPIEFRVDVPIPYFQVTDNHRIRFGYEKLSLTLIREILSQVLSDEMSMTFLLKTIDEGREFKKKGKLKRFFTFNNWKEELIQDNEDLRICYVMVKVNGIKREEIIKYAQYIVGEWHWDVFLHFFNETVDIFINEDVIDIVSPDERFIKDLKSKYESIYDRYWVQE